MVRLGLRANAPQFWLLVGLNAVVGALVGLERSVLPLVGRHDFGLASKSAILGFIVAFGAAKALANLATGPLAKRHGRRRVLLAGWALALPAPLLIGLAPSWGFVVAANLFLGASQGLAWSMTVLMKIDLVGERRRGFALGLNESAGYLGVALTAGVTGALAASIAPRTLIWAGTLVLACAGLAISVFFVRDTAGHVALEQASAAPVRPQPTLLAACSQAGFVNNLNDALAWGLVPIYLAAHGASAGRIGVVAAVYPAVWGALQLATGALSDFLGRRSPIVAGMLLQGAALGLLAGSAGRFGLALAAAVLLGIGTALVYPTLLAAVSDAVSPRNRGHAVARYRFWRDAGLVAGAVGTGVVSDAAGSGPAIAAVAGLTAASGLVFLLLTVHSERRPAWQLT
jgi:MFS family permease